MDPESIIFKQKDASELLKVSMLPPLSALSGLPQEVKQAKADKKFRKLNKEPTTAKQLIVRPDVVKPQLTVDPLPPLQTLSGLKDEARGAKAAQVVSQVKGANKALSDGDPNEAETILERSLTDEELVNGRVGVPNGLSSFSKISTESDRLQQVLMAAQDLLKNPSQSALIKLLKEAREQERKEDKEDRDRDNEKREFRDALKQELPEDDDSHFYKGEKGEKGKYKGLTKRLSNVADENDPHDVSFAMMHGQPEDVPIDDIESVVDTELAPTEIAVRKPAVADLGDFQGMHEPVEETGIKVLARYRQNPDGKYRKDDLKMVIEELRMEAPSLKARGLILSNVANTIPKLKEQIDDALLQIEGMKQTAATAEEGTGLKKTKEKPKYLNGRIDVPFGTRFVVDKNKLKQNILSLRTLKGASSYEFPVAEMRPEVTDVIRALLDPESHDLNFDELTEVEQHFIRRLVKTAHVNFILPMALRIKPRMMTVEESGTLKQRMVKKYEILRGEMDAGNDNKIMKGEMKKLIFKMMDNRLLTGPEVELIMEEYDLPKAKKAPVA